VAYIKWRLLSQRAESIEYGVKGKEKKEQTGEYRRQDPGGNVQDISEKTNNIFGLKSVFWYLGSVICAVLAMKTKELAFMLPVMLILYEMIFFEGKMKKRAIYLIPFIITMLIIPLTMISIDKPIGELIGDVDETVHGNTELSRGEYLITEFRVLVTYLRLVFLPVNQNLDYDYSRYSSFFNTEVLSSFLFLALIFGLSIYILFRYRDTAPHTRIISFGIIWFFINLLLESSIIPLNNVIFEHRMYLPSVGVFSALTVAIFMAIHRWKAYARIITAMLAVIIIVLTGASYARNSVWKDGLTLWQDVVNKSPGKARGYNNLGDAYLSIDRIEKAKEFFKEALKRDPYNPKAYINRGNAARAEGFIDEAIEYYQKAINVNAYMPGAYNNLGVAYESKGLIDKAINYFQSAIRYDAYYSDPHYNLGNIYYFRGLNDKAIDHYKIAISLDPDYPDTYTKLGNAYMSRGSLDKAIQQYQIAIKHDPENLDSHVNLGIVYHSQGLIDRAIEQYRVAIRLKPDFQKSYYNLGNAYMKKGLIDDAIIQYLAAIRLKPDSDAHNNLGIAYRTKGFIDKTIEQYLLALKIKPDYPEAHHNLGIAYQSQGETDLAIRAYNNALRLRPGWELPRKKLDQLRKERLSGES
jgi:tetratricopeptide (TPR) repeat protein